MQTLFEKKIYLSDPNETVISFSIKEFGHGIRLDVARSGNILSNGFLMSSVYIDFRNPTDWLQRINSEVLPQTVIYEINQQLVRLKGLLVFL
jgi:hypothetical protein